MNRNIFSLVFNRARGVLVVAPEIAKGTHKSARTAKRSAKQQQAIALRFVLSAVVFAGAADCVHAQTNLGLPSGSILDINNGNGANSASYATPNVFQNYSVTFTAQDTGNNYLLFAFRQDPAYWTFGNVSMVLNGTSTNLLVDPTFTQGGQLSSQSGLQAPADWGIVYQSGTTPSAAGQWYGPGQAPDAPGQNTSYSTTNVNQGTAGSWYDGAVGSFDGIYQGINLVAGDTYTISFTALSNDVANVAGAGSNGVELGVFAGRCVSLTGAASDCTPDNPNFIPLATPGQAANAGSPATDITSTSNAAGLASSPATLLPVFDGGTLVLDGTSLSPYNFTLTGNGGTVDLAGQSATIANPIADDSAGTPGSLAVVNSGNGGSLTLTGNNTYTGSTSIGNGATLALSGTGSIASSSGLTDNGHFDISQASGTSTIASLGGNGQVALGGNDLAIASGHDTFSGSIQGQGGVQIDGGTQVFSGNNSYTGGTQFNGGTLQVSSDANLGAASGALNFHGGTLENTGSFTSSRDINITNVANFNTDDGAVLTDTTGAITGTGSINKLGGGTLILGADNSSGGVTVNDGTLQFNGAGSYTGATQVAAGANLVLSGAGDISHSSVVDVDGSFDISQAGNRSITSLAGSGNVDLGGNTLTLSQAADTFSGSIQGTGGVEVAAGTQTLTGQNSYLGTTQIDQGATLALSANGALSNSALSGGVLANGSFDISHQSGDVQITTLSGSGQVQLGSNALLLDNASGDFSGSIQGQGGVVLGYGNQTLSGNNTYQGGTHLQGGSLSVSADQNLGDAAGALSFGNARLENTASFTTTRDISITDQAHFDTDANTVLTDTAGTISGNGAIVKEGDGTLILGANNANGGVEVQDGRLQLTGAGTGNGAVMVDTDGTLALTGNGSIASANYLFNNGHVDVSQANGDTAIRTIVGNGQLELGNNNLVLTQGAGSYAGGISGQGGVVLQNGVQQFTGTNTYQGGTTLGGGTLVVNSDAGLGDASGALHFTGGMLETTADITSTRAIDAGTQANFYVDSQTTLTDTQGAITGNGSIVKNGDGTLVLGADHAQGGVFANSGTLVFTGASTDTGSIYIGSSGTLALSGDGAVSQAQSINNAGVFDLSQANGDRSINSLSGSNGSTVNLGGNSLTLTQASGSYAGSIGGQGGVNITGGIEALSGNNTYAGGTGIADGTLVIQSDANLGDASGALRFAGGTLESTASVTSTRDIQMDGGATFQVDTGVFTDTAGDLTGTGPLTKSGIGTLVLGADHSTGGINVQAGSLQLTGASTDTGSIGVATGATLALTGDGSVAHAASIDNDGTFDISQANTTQSIGSLAGTGTVSLGQNGLDLTNAHGDFAGSISGQGGLTMSGGTEVLSGNNSYSGGTTLAGGTLAVSSDGNLGAAGGALTFNGGTLENTASFTTTRDIVLDGPANIHTDTGTTLVDTSGSITGSGGLTKSGAGVLVLGADHGTGGVNIGGGTLVLTEASTDDGPTQIASGATLALSGHGTTSTGTNIDNEGTFDLSAASVSAAIGSLSGNGTVNLGGNNLDLTHASGTFNGSIGGQGGLTLSGGTEVLGGNNTYAGGTTIRGGGNLVVSSDANLGATGTPVTFDGGTLTVTQSMDTNRNLVIDNGGANFNTLGGVTVHESGNLSGSGGLVKSGDGTLIVSGVNTFTGGTLIDGGVVKIDTGSSLGTGDILLNGGILQSTATLNNGQNVQISGNAGVNVDSGTTTVLSGQLQQANGSGCFVKSGMGTLSLTGTAVLGGGTCVQQGMLRANGNLVSNVTVDEEGELRGIGVINGPISVAGRLAPGNSPGTLAVAGTVTMKAGSTYEEDIDGLGTGTGAGNYSRLLISGANNRFIANGSLMPQLRQITGNASNTYVPSVGDMYRIITAQGGIEGQFSSVVQPDGLAPHTRFVAFYDVNGSNSIDLGVLPESYASAVAGTGVTRNASAVAQALDRSLAAQAAGNGSAGQSALLYAVASAKADQLGGVLQGLSGEVFADQAAAARGASLAMHSDTLGHLTVDDSDVSGEHPGHLAWANVSHTGNRWSGDAQGSGFQSGINQTTAGIDLYAGYGSVIGLGVSNHESDVNNNASHGTIRGTSAIVYGQQALGGLVLDGVAAYGHDTWITRRPDPTGEAGSINARAGGNDSMAGLTLRMPMQKGGSRIEPYVSVIWQQFDRSALTEQGSSPAALQFDRLKASGTRALLGVNFGSLLQNPLAGESTYRVGAAVGEDSRGLLSPTVHAALQGESFDLQAPQIGRSFVQFNANATLRLSHSAYLYGGLTDEFGARRSSYGVNAGVRVQF